MSQESQENTEVFCKKGVLKKETPAQEFSCEFCEFEEYFFYELLNLRQMFSWQSFEFFKNSFF